MYTNTILMMFLILLVLIMLFKTRVTFVDIQAVPDHAHIKPIGGCAGTRYGCCTNGVTARMNPAGTNC